MVTVTQLATEKPIEDIESRFQRHIKEQHKREYTDSEMTYLLKPFDVEPISIPSSNVLRDPINFSPEPDFVWIVLRITAQTFTGGSVNVFKGSLTSISLTSFTAAGSQWFSPGQISVYGKNSSLVFQGVTLTGTANISVGGLSVHKTILARYFLAGG